MMLIKLKYCDKARRMWLTSPHSQRAASATVLASGGKIYKREVRALVVKGPAVLGRRYTGAFS